MFRILLRAGSSRKNSNILEVVEQQLGYPHSLLTHDKNAGNDLQYTITSVQGKNIKGPYLLYYGRAINIGGFTQDTTTRRVAGGKVETPKDETANVVLRRINYIFYPYDIGNNGNTFFRGPCLRWGFYTGFKNDILYDEGAMQHIFLGKKILITGDTADREYNGGQMREFPSIFLEREGDYYSNVFFQLEYTDDSTREVENEEIEIICELYRE